MAIIKFQEFAVISTLAILVTSFLVTSADHHEGHEGTQGFDEECVLKDPDMACKSDKGLYCNSELDKAKCVCSIQGSFYDKAKDSCLANVGGKCRYSEIIIPCFSSNATCNPTNQLCECGKGLNCAVHKVGGDGGGGGKVLPSLTVSIALAITMGVTYLVL